MLDFILNTGEDGKFVLDEDWSTIHKVRNLIRKDGVFYFGDAGTRGLRTLAHSGGSLGARDARRAL